MAPGSHQPGGPGRTAQLVGVNLGRARAPGQAKAVPEVTVLSRRTRMSQAVFDAYAQMQRETEVLRAWPGRSATATEA